jgi:hypothetical protein
VSEFIAECRREWRRLGVPEPAANEMAADLTADLKEAEKEGVSAEEVLGSGAFDARAFAASWASERGLVPIGWRNRIREHRRLTTALVFVVLLVATGITAAFLISSHHSRPAISDGVTAPQPTVTARSLAIPDVHGLQQEEAISVARAAGFQVRISVQPTRRQPAGSVLSQSPAAGTTVALGSTVVFVVARPPHHTKRP